VPAGEVVDRPPLGMADAHGERGFELAAQIGVEPTLRGGQGVRVDGVEAREQCLLLCGPRRDGRRRVVADESAGVGGDAVQPGRIGLHAGVAYEVVIGDGADGIGCADEERRCQDKEG
jgi:hypothetical protein